MFDLDIPGFGRLTLNHLVLDFNGTLARDGALIPGVAERLAALSQILTVRVLTADTFGTVRVVLAGLPLTVEVLKPGAEDQAKLAYVESLGAASCAAMGNGRNDRLMVQAAGLGVAVLGPEGASPATLAAGQVTVPHICVGLDLLLHPKRLLATLRT
jgi:soluble P-type ATPase